MGDDEGRQLVAGEPGEGPSAQGQSVRGGDGFRAEMLIEQHRQGGETAAIAGVDEEEHGEHRQSSALSMLFVTICNRQTAMDMTKIMK